MPSEPENPAAKAPKKPFPIRWVFYIVFAYVALHTLYFILFAAE